MDKNYSDVGRTCIHGQPTPQQSKLYRGMMEAHRRLLEALQPDKPIWEVYQAGRKALDQTGLQRISRGHFGHSLGLDSKIEEPPFISSFEKSRLQPGMVLAVETPCYVEGVGKYQIEDMVLITETGYTNFNPLSKEWIL